LLREIFFPTGALRLNEKNLAFVRKKMSTLPGESSRPIYDPIEFPTAYVKYLMVGRIGQLPPGITIYNKVGRAYGFVSDNAYIVDSANNIEFLLSAAIYVNRNQRFNDNEYEYEEIAFPFMRNLGQLIYDYEVDQKSARGN
jgi:hypothetical protein